MIELDFESKEPIYNQLLYQIKHSVLKGDLKPGEALPSVRQLASDVGVNLHTINKAYKLLLAEGLLDQGNKGFYITAKQPKMSQESYQVFKEKLKELQIDASIYGINLVELLTNGKESEINE